MRTTDIVAAAYAAPDSDPLDPAPQAPPFLPDPFANLPLPWPVMLGIALAALMVVLVAGRAAYRGLIPPPGYATALDIRREMSAASARARIAVLRPSLAGRRRLPVTEYSYPIGRSFSPFMWVRGTPEDSAAIIGPPGSSKTVWLTNLVIDAPGPVVHTSSKVDDHMRTWRFREQVGPVHRINPQMLGGMKSTARINPVIGCENYDTARHRAALLLYGARKDGQSNNLNDYFNSHANEVLSAHLHAAALAGGTLLDCHRWANDPDDVEPLELLDEHGARRTVFDVLKSRMQITDRTRDGIFSSLATALAWLSSEEAAWCVSPPRGEELDLRRLILDCGTLYLISADEPGQGCAPLFTLLVTELLEITEELANAMPGRRLDPWLTLALDEVATICPLPLDQWMSKVRAHGILPVIALQSRSQLVQRWDRAGADTIENVVAYTLALRGIKNPQDLRDLSELCGQHEVERTTVQHGPGGVTRSRHTEMRATLPPHKVRQIRRGRMLVIYRGAPPVVVKIRQPWKRRDLKRRDKAIQAAQAAAPATTAGMVRN